MRDGVAVRGGPHDLHAGGVEVDDEHRVPARPRPLGQLRLEEAVVGEVGGRDVPLLAVEHVLVALPAGRRLDRVHVRARALLRDRVALEPLAPDGREEPGLHLVLGGHSGEPAGRRGDDPTESVRDPADLLLHEDLLKGGEPRAPQLPRDVDGGEAQLAAPALVTVRDVGRELSPAQLGIDLEGDQLVGQAPGSRLGLAVGLAQREHPDPPVVGRKQSTVWPFNESSAPLPMAPIPATDRRLPVRTTVQPSVRVPPAGPVGARGTTRASTATQPSGPATTGLTSMASMRSPSPSARADRRAAACATATTSAGGRPRAPWRRGRIRRRSSSRRCNCSCKRFVSGQCGVLNRRDFACNAP